MNKNLTEVLADLRLDLADSGALWSDSELTRCVKRAVGDLSRFLPRELTHEVTLDAEVDDESFTTPAASDTDRFVVDTDISAKVAGNTMTLTGSQPDMARPVKITITDASASITAFRIIVKGNAAAGHYIEESFFLSGGLIQTGKRHFKRILEVEIDAITGNGTDDKLMVGTGSSTGVWVELANKPIEYDSETITNYTRDTDYEMDYVQGRIALKSGTTMSEATAYTIDYSKSLLHVDLSNLEDFIRVDRVEHPVGQIPQEYVTPEVYGKVLVVRSSNYQSQSKMSDEQHILIHYLASQLPPAASAPGSYPSFLNFTVELAASAYALFMKAVQYEHQAVTDLASVRTELGLTTAVHTLADAALDKAAALLVATTGKIDAALVKVTTYLTDNTNEDSKFWLTKITTDIAGLRTAILTAVDAANSELDAGDLSAVATHLTEADAALDKVTTHCETGVDDSALGALAKITDNIAELRTKVETAASAIATALGLVTTTSLDAATVGAEAYLTAGDDEINTVGLGSRVPENYREFAQARVDIANARVQQAMGYAQEAAQRLDDVRTYVEEANGWTRIAEAFVAEASQRVAMAAQVVNRESVVATQAAGYVNEAAARLDNLRTYIEQAAGWGRVAETFIAEASQHIAAANAAVNEASGRMAEMDRYLAEAAQYQVAAQNCMTLAQTFRAEAAERRNEAWTIWRNPPEYSPMYTLGTGKQVKEG